MTEVTAQSKRRTGLLIWLIFSQLLAIGSLWIWVVVAGLSVMAFDESGSPALSNCARHLGTSAIPVDHGHQGMGRMCLPREPVGSLAHGANVRAAGLALSLDFDRAAVWI